MIKDVVIKIVGSQGIDEQTDTIEFITDARFGIKDNEYYLSYDEGQMFETKEDVKTKIYIKSDNSILLERKGSVNSRMIIEKGVRNTCFYSTIHGDLVLGVFGEQVSYNLNEKGGEINLSYTLDTEMQLLSRNNVKIIVSEV